MFWPSISDRIKRFPYLVSYRLFDGYRTGELFVGTVWDMPQNNVALSSFQPEKIPPALASPVRVTNDQADGCIVDSLPDKRWKRGSHTAAFISKQATRQEGLSPF